MKKIRLMLAVLMIYQSLALAKNVKYTYNEGGGCISRIEYSDILTPPNSKSISSMPINVENIDIDMDFDAIHVRITSDKNDISVDYILSNVLGQTLRSGTFKSLTNTIDISQYPSGTYILALSAEDGIVSKKLIKP